MDALLTIGEVARRTGLPATTIRYYEAAGVVPTPARTLAGYRAYSVEHVRRLQLAASARLVGFGLDEVKRLVAQASDAECADFLHEYLEAIARRGAQTARRIAELQAFDTLLQDVATRIHDAACDCSPGQTAADCDYCPVLTEEGGEANARPLSVRLRMPV